MIIKNYNSTLALSDYNLGDACACYIHNRHLERLATADVKTVSKYSSTLTKITSDEDFEAFMAQGKLKGFGATDFRPAFTYVEELREKKEFAKNKYLIRRI